MTGFDQPSHLFPLWLVHLHTVREYAPNKLLYTFCLLLFLNQKTTILHESISYFKVIIFGYHYFREVIIIKEFFRKNISLENTFCWPPPPPPPPPRGGGGFFFSPPSLWGGGLRGG